MFHNFAFNYLSMSLLESITVSSDPIPLSSLLHNIGSMLLRNAKELSNLHVLSAIVRHKYYAAFSYC